MESAEFWKSQFSNKMGLRLLLKPGQDNWSVSVVILLLKGSTVMILRGNNNIQVVYYDELVLLEEFLSPF